MKEKSQLQERVTSLEEQSIKETSSIGLQFNYLIPSMGKSIITYTYHIILYLIDNLDCLSSVQVAEKKLFLIQGGKPRLINWEKFGLRIGVQKESLLSSETVEVAVVALVGGQFQFPPNTVLVSAVYAVSLSKPLLKRLKLEIQHCVDLTGRPDLAQYLKFAIAPVSTPSLPYQFSIVEGGEFSSNGGYGFIEREDFCLVCILGLLIAGDDGGGGGGGGGGGQQQPQGQGVGVVPAQQQQGGGGVLTVLAQGQQPGGANQQTNGQQGEEVQERQQEEGDKSQEGRQQQQQDESQRQQEGQQEGQQQQEQSQKGEESQAQHREGGDNQEGGRGQEEKQQDPVHVETETVSKVMLCTETSKHAY